MTRAAKIAIVCTELGVGGAERCVARLAASLDRARFAPHVLALAPPPATDRGELVEQLAAADVNVHFLGLRSLWQYATGRRQLRRELQALRPDLIQSFLFHANVLSLRAAPAEIPVVTGIRVADPRRWRHWIERRANRGAAKIVCVSESVRGFCERQARFPSEKLCVIPNGIELAGLPAPPLHERVVDMFGHEIPPGRRIVLCVGRLHEQKGYDWLLPQWSRWGAAHPDCDLWIAGDGPDRDRLVMQAESLGLASRVRFLGQRPDVPKLLATCRLLLLPSRWEGMPNVVLEAMASGKPVLASRVEGVTELLGESLTAAQSAPFADSDAWSARLDRLLQDESFSQQLGAQNRQRIEQHFQSQQMTKRYEALYAELLGQ